MSELQGLSSTANADADNHPQSNDSTTSDKPLAGSASPSDSASSLRAAALLTLRSKRRKPSFEKPISPSLWPIPTLVLNYGEEESTSSAATPLSAPEEATTSLAKISTAEAQDNREEGEISDTESVLPAVQKPKPLTSKASKSKTILTDKNLTLKTSPTSVYPPATVKPLSAPSKKTESTSIIPIAGSSTSATHLTAQPQIPSYVVDPDHVRPGLAMNEKQYDAAKDIVLDLLGWGVDPEYFINIGVSREIIFYVFTELHLRLPRNLDTTGLIPFLPSGPEPSATIRQQRSKSSVAAMPPPLSVPPHHDTPSFSSTRVTHPSLPQKPPAPQGNLPVSPVLKSNSGPPSQLSVLTNVREIEQQRKHTGAETNLHEIEQLRKKELIARKAVQASRKNKAAAIVAGPSLPVVSSPLASSEVKDKDIDMTSIVAEESVDDFLKSIGPAPDADSGSGTADDASSTKEAVLAQFRRHESPAHMDVDEIPGFSGSGKGNAAPSRPLSAQSKGDLSTSPGTTSRPPTEPPTSSVDSNSDFPKATPIEREDSPRLKEDIPPGEHDVLQSDPGRRGMKRPVASDFVDFESASSRSSSGYSNGGASQPPSLRRKTTGSFASVSGMRRCVIDLSDSEDDGAEETRRLENERNQRIYSPLPTRLHGTTSSTPHTTNGGDWAPPQHRALNGHAGTQSPAALFEKEEEIKRMRGLIAMREQSRLKKLAAMSGQTSAPINDSSAVPQVTPAPSSEAVSTIKQEESDSSPGLPVVPADGGSHATNGHSHDTSEHAKMHDIVHGFPWQGSGTVIPVSELVAPNSRNVSATPPIGDYLAPNAMENVDTGEQVLTAEAQQEQVDTYTMTRPEQRARKAVDVNDISSSSSTQASGIQDVQRPQAGFPTYDSPFESYPFLRSRLRRMLSDDSLMALQERPQQEAQPQSHSFSSSSSLRSFISSSSLPSSFSVVSPKFIPDLGPLKKAASFKAMDPSKQICQYELPGGGVCRDEGCQDVHLSRGLDGLGVDGIEPTDEDTAEYIFDVLSSASDDTRPWLTQERGVMVGAVRGALQGLRGAGKGYEERVAEALATLRPPAPVI